MRNKLLSLLFVAIIFAFSTSALAGWELYDDFSSPGIDTQRWDIDNTSAAISNDNGRAKFVHLSGNANDSAYLLFNQTPETIIGIKADVFIESCTGDVRTRLTGHSGNIGENHVWSAVQLEPGKQRIYTSANIEGPPPEYTLVQELFYAQFERPLTVTGVPFNLAIEFSSDKITYEVDGHGKIAYKYATAIAPSGNNFKAIGTRSTLGQGPCTVYFDNVEVLRP